MLYKFIYYIYYSIICPGQSVFLSSPSFPIICIMVLMRPLYHPIHLGVVQHGSQLLHTKDFTHLVNDAAHGVCTPIAQEPCWGPKDWDVTLIQELGNCLSGLIRGHVCHYVLHKMVQNTRMFVTLASLLSSRVISILVKSTCKRSIREVAKIRCRGALDKLPSLLAMWAGLNRLSHLIGHAWPPDILL